MTSLDDTCEKYIGELLFVETQYGYGWDYPENINKKITNIEMEPIPNFQFRLQEFKIFQNNLRRGGIGIIEDETCKYNKSIIEFDVRHEGRYNFDSEIAVYNIIIKTINNLNSKSQKNGVGGYGKIFVKT
ncbi:MAG TPA: hypothetical protein PK307_03325 [Spirochaetota bacterium]|nr:hypothetical protein [Spirochaetota bacterium]HOD14901.1 hypothetical protein [Spirochaetota bacterium]HPG49325.1 hypothetical protein [Spirochaetota bacterium]HPN10699.1 hypothetical protein [Spirochaetota bacterium]HQL81204.1 hypothetical protein [Spirochaetota bacterium]